MRANMRPAWGALLGLALGGCMVGPLVENPLFVQKDPTVSVANPIWVPSPGVEDGGYGKVFEKVIDILDDYFEIAYANRYDGRIRTFPRISPGYEQFWKASTPDHRERLHATLQTMRQFAEVEIQPAEDGGFFVKLKVTKELEDLPRPLRSTAGAAAFRNDNNVERQLVVIDASPIDANWIPQGNDLDFEQLILQRIKKCN